MSIKNLFSRSKSNELRDDARIELERQTYVIAAIQRSMAVIEFNPNGTIIKANDNFLNTVGYNASEIEGKHHRIFCDKEYANTPEYAQFWKSLNAGKFSTGQFRRLNKSGEVVWLEATYNPIFDRDGQLSSIIKFATDITERVAQDLINKGQLDALSRSTAIVEFNMDGIVVSCNENFEQTMGYNMDDLVDKHHRIFCEPDYANSPEYEEFWFQLNQGKFTSGKFKRVNRQGQGVWLEASYNPVFDPDGKLTRVVKFASDVTESTIRAEAERDSAMVAYRISSETSKTAESGGQVIYKAVQEMNKIADSVRGSSSHIENLNKQSNEINSIIKTIQDIADQTNLLALNAAIEAARAGDQGRGFAVVADEVRQLAARTTHSTSEISTMISNIQSETGSASDSMRTCLDQVEVGVDLANQTGKVIGQIQQEANEVVTAIDQFSSQFDASNANLK